MYSFHCMLKASCDSGFVILYVLINSPMLCIEKELYREAEVGSAKTVN